MKIKTLEDLLVDLIKDTYSAENQLLKALPKMAKKATTAELKKGFEMHTEQTKIQKERLEQIAEIMDITPKGKKCAAMEGLIEEAEEVIESVKEGPVLDAALIAASQKVEHYEIASYGTAATFAKKLGLKDVVKLLVLSLEEEKATDEKLTKVAEGLVNEKAAAVA